MSTSPWLTVVTVVRDDLVGLRRTLASMAAQDLDGVEYLVVDSSTDHDSVRDLLIQAGVEANCTWVPPRGVYPAMNEGLHQATGAFVYFLNAGDSLHDPDVLGSVRPELARPGVLWAFGPVEIVSVDGTRTLTPPWDYAVERSYAFSRGHFPPHQGTFAGARLLREVGGFDPAYPIVADYAAFLRMSRIGDPLILDRVIASFVEGGLSTRQWKASVGEFHRARAAILKPRGLASLRERYETAAQFGRLWLVRDLLRRGR